jgi:excisionase family DNA binding protein
VSSQSVKPLFVNCATAAEILGISAQMIGKLIKNRRLRAHYVGSCVRIRVSDLETVVENYDPAKPRGVRSPKKRRAA